VRNQQVAVGLVAVLVVGALIGGILLNTRKNRVQLDGEVLKVRSHQMDGQHTLALVDVRLKNPSTQQFMVRDIEVYVDDAQGKSLQADVFSEIDAQRVITYYPMLGKKYNQGLVRRDRIGSGQTVDRTVAISAPMTDDRLGERKRIRFVIHDADGPTVEVAEKR